MSEAEHEYGITPIAGPRDGILPGRRSALPTASSRNSGWRNIRKLGTPDSVLFDVKYLFPRRRPTDA